LFLAFFLAFLGLVWHSQFFVGFFGFSWLFSAHLNRKCAYQYSPKLEKNRQTNCHFSNIFKHFPHACKSPKYALKSSKFTTHRGENYFEFFKSAFGVFWHISVLNLAFSAHWHLATLLQSTTQVRQNGERKQTRKREASDRSNEVMFSL
jgi:hypothetical protein